MEAEVFNMEILGDQVLDLPDIVDYAQLQFREDASWIGFEELQLFDFEPENEKLQNIIMPSQRFVPLVNVMLGLYKDFADATNLAARMSAVLRQFVALQRFFNSFLGEIGGDEKPAMVMFLLSQAVHRNPGLPAKIYAFEQEMGVAREARNYPVDKVVIPVIQDDPEMQQVLNDPAQWIEVIRVQGYEFPVDGVMEGYGPQLGRDIMTVYRQRIVATLAEGLPPAFIRAACLQPNWPVELKKLRDPVFRSAFTPVYNAEQQYERQQTLQFFIWFLEKPGFFRNNQMLAAVHPHMGLEENYLLDKNEDWRANTRKMLIHHALVMFSVDQGKLLAGVMAALFKTQGNRVINKKWKRNLYKCSLRRVGKWAWRKYIQEDILKITKSEWTKEIVKSTIETATDTSRNDDKDSWRGRDLIAAMFGYFNQDEEAEEQ
jgi:hypothetical protein